MEFIAGFLMGFAWGVGLTVLFIIQIIQKRQRETKITREEFLEMGFDPLGCELDHLPGDCPLCGAD